ncbi:MAG TPA: PilZ domain-containing protein [Vicinamibacterales bacterium]
MAVATSIVIVRPEHLGSIKKRLSEADFVAVFSETEWLSVQDSVLARPPEVLIMQNAFAATSRGATLVSALKAKPREHGTALRVFIEDDVKAPMILAQADVPAIDALLETSRPLDRAGTRQAARYPMNRLRLTVNGDPAELIDLSISGAQVQAASRMRPLKVARVTLFDERAETKLQGTVAWAIAVPDKGAIMYRAGIEFVNPDQKKLAAYCAKHGGAPDPTLSRD